MGVRITEYSAVVLLYHVANTNQISQLYTQRHASYTCTPHAHSHQHSGELVPTPTFVSKVPFSPVLQGILENPEPDYRFVPKQSGLMTEVSLWTIEYCQ